MMEDEKINQPMTELAGEAAKAERAGGLLESRDYYKPFQYPWAYEAFMQSEQMHWLWTEVPMLEDVKDYQQKLTDSERDFLTKILRFFPPDVSIAYLHACHFLACKKGLKSLYYNRSDKLRKADRVGVKAERKRIEDEIDMRAVADNSSCLACEG